MTIRNKKDNFPLFEKRKGNFYNKLMKFAD